MTGYLNCELLLVYDSCELCKRNLECNGYVTGRECDGGIELQWGHLGFASNQVTSTLWSCWEVVSEKVRLVLI